MSTEEDTKPAPFWQRLNTFFLFPLQPKPLMYALVLSMCSLLFKALPFLHEVFAVLIVLVGVLLAVSRYSFKVIALGSRGISTAADFPHELDEDWKNLPWKLFGILLVKGFIVGLLEGWSSTLGVIGLFVVCFTLPASMMLLVQTCSFWEALNPAGVIDTIRIVGWPYVLVCLFLFMLSGGSEIAIGMLVPIFQGIILLPLITFVTTYFSWVMSSLLGYVMYQHHQAFGVDLLPGAGGDERRVEQRSPEQIAQQAIDAQVSERITQGDIAGAVGVAYEEQRTKPQDLIAQRRYHKVLLLSDKLSSLLDHATRFIPLLMRYQQTTEALKVFKACRSKDPKFVLDDAAITLALAQAEWRNGEAKGTLALISGFDKRFSNHESVPQAYELAARALVQGLGRHDMAQAILRTLETRYPNAEPTQEVRWLLRQTPTAS
jgi:hypothetical protein